MLRVQNPWQQQQKKIYKFIYLKNANKREPKYEIRFFFFTNFKAHNVNDTNEEKRKWRLIIAYVNSFQIFVSSNVITHNVHHMFSIFVIFLFHSFSYFIVIRSICYPQYDDEKQKQWKGYFHSIKTVLSNERIDEYE